MPGSSSRNACDHVLLLKIARRTELIIMWALFREALLAGQRRLAASLLSKAIVIVTMVMATTILRLNDDYNNTNNTKKTIP